MRNTTLLTTETVAAADHQRRSPKSRTCTEDGVRTYTASVTFGEKNYTDTKTEGIKATGEHVWDNGVVTTEPTCTAKGVKTYTCTKCSATKTEELNALGHNYETKRTEPTCEKDGKEERSAPIAAMCGSAESCLQLATATAGIRVPEEPSARTAARFWTKAEDTKPATRSPRPKPGKTDTKFPFTDVSKNDRCYDAVEYLYNNGIMNGTTDTLFSPNAELTRAMVVTILYRAQGKPAVSTSGSFKDVAAGRYYTEAVEWAAANNIVKGFTDGTFKPDEPVTREQLAAFLSRFAEYNDIEIVAADGKLERRRGRVQLGKEERRMGCCRGHPDLRTGQERNAERNAC